MKRAVIANLVCITDILWIFGEGDAGYADDTFQSISFIKEKHGIFYFTSGKLLKSPRLEVSIMALQLKQVL